MLIDIHTHRKETESDVKSLVSLRLGIEQVKETGGPYSIGIHPWDVDIVDIGSCLSYLEHAPVQAIGEVGIDFHHSQDNKLKQTEVFRKQLSIAERRSIPVIIHCVKAYNEVLDELNNYKLRDVIFHGFIGSSELSKRLINQGYYISFGKRSLDSPKTLQALLSCPLNRLFLETDENEDNSIKDLYNIVACRLNIGVERLEQQIEVNYNNIFK